MTRQRTRTSPDDAVFMARAIGQRGPDDEGFVFIDRERGKTLSCSGTESDHRIRQELPAVDRAAQGFPHQLALAHRRYAIIDTGPSGHQPMWDASGTLCVVFNGELYNYVELRAVLEQAGSRFRTRSDTEVLLEAYRAWGTAAFERMNGPLAAAFYDGRTGQLVLCRDRLGKAPLYYLVLNDALYFASEIKAFLAIPAGRSLTVRDQAVHDYAAHGYRDIDGTFWSDVQDFPPATFATVRSDLTVEPRRYWDLPKRRLTSNDISADEAAGTLRDLLTDAVRLRMRADVPVAFELSGGMDSSSLVALAAGLAAGPITTYTVRFPDAEANEEPYARSLAAQLGAKVDYRVIDPAPTDFWQDADEFLWTEEEPFHSPNLHTNQHLRRQIKADGVKIVITGSAGDEVLAGYAGEYATPYLADLMRQGRLAAFCRELRMSSEIPWHRGLLDLGTGVLGFRRFRPALDRVLSRDAARSGYRQPAGSIDRLRPNTTSLSERLRENMSQWMMNYWLRSGNKASFGIPIEPRSPFLDYRVVDLAFSLPPEYLIRDGWHKWLLRRSLQQVLPDAILWRRRKMGFPFPYLSWLLASKPVVSRLVLSGTCPYVDGRQLMDRYDRAADRDPQQLWRLINLFAWWQRVVQGRRIGLDGDEPASGPPLAGGVRMSAGTR